MTSDARTDPYARTWARNLAYSSTTAVRPRSLDELADVVTSAPRVKALGSRHSFNDVADTTGVHVVLDALDDGRPAVDVDPVTGVASVRAGLRYGDVVGAIDAAGRALGNLASLPHIGVAGATATSTHGSGDRQPSLAGSVVGLEVVTGAGERLTLRRGAPDFAGSVVHLGALGVVTRVELATEATFDVEQTVFEHLPWSAVHEGYDAITASARSVSLFTTWGDEVEQVWRKAQVGVDVPSGPALFGAPAARTALHPVPGVSPEHCTPQLGSVGRWYDRLPHFRLEFTPSNGDELQSEYQVPRERFGEAVEAMRAVGHLVRPVLQITELRTVAADRLWLSPFSRPAGDDRGFVGFHFTWLPDAAGVAAVLPAVEAALLPLGARPHWGKVFAADVRDVGAAYPDLPRFRALADRLDPEHRFRGGYVERLLG